MEGFLALLVLDALYRLTGKEKPRTLPEVSPVFPSIFVLNLFHLCENTLAN